MKFYAMTLLKMHSCSTGFNFLDHYVDGCRSNDVDVGRSPINESWLVNKGPLSESTRLTCTLWASSKFAKLKYLGLSPIMFQCGASITESCSALKKHRVFDMNSRTFQMLHINIELAVVIPSNTKRRRNVFLMFGQRHRQWYNIKQTKKSKSRSLKFQFKMDLKKT